MVSGNFAREIRSLVWFDVRFDVISCTYWYWYEFSAGIYVLLFIPDVVAVHFRLSCAYVAADICIVVIVVAVCCILCCDLGLCFVML